MSASLPERPRILVVRLSSLGDVILTTPVLERIKTVWPQSDVTVLTKKSFADVFNGNPHVDHVDFFETRGVWGWLQSIRQKRYDLYVDLHGTLRSRLWGVFSGSGQKVRYDKKVWARRLLVWRGRRSSELRGTVVDRYLNALSEVSSVDDSSAMVPPRLYVDRQEVLAKSWEDELTSLALRAKSETPLLIGVAPGAKHATKQWPASRFAAAVDALVEKIGTPAGILVFGAPMDREAAEEVTKHTRVPVLNLAGKTTLTDLMLLVKRCSLFLTNDSGAMHIASAWNVPTVAIFGPTVREFGFFPQGTRSAVVEKADLVCRPCTLHGTDVCPQGHFRCMKDIAVDEVVQRAFALYQKSLSGLS